ncbi:alpha/beta fold hydrolase [Gracilibacillus salinarum]|uniref:Alpha/beta hydrolase n=1 Tax=Gracilibacillus salinarum TaxID=2932255 RepID=A0ABY4GQI2_9BACI|nr:alpha/beta hydrolase [Gracilibacillus salinarum]UOQ86225.1 alpha/beta hydrolase [Gracilibacillus salinarum]
MPYTETQPSLYFQCTGSGTAIIFISPPAMGHLTFRYQQLLKDHFKVITFDNRGDCRSSNKDETLQFSDFVNDVKRILDANDISQAIICGYSNGGLLAQEFALQYPNHTLALILIGGYHSPANSTLRLEYKIGISIAKWQWISLLAKALSFNHFRDKKAAKDMELEIKKTNPHSLTQQYQLGLHYQATDRLHHIHCPLLLIYGANDFYVHSYRHGFQEKIGDTEVAYIHHSKHQVPTKYYNECNAIIYEWSKRKKWIK